MSYAVDGKKQVAIATGSALFIFGPPTRRDRPGTLSKRKYDGNMA
jgi:hypothetical protein